MHLQGLFARRSRLHMDVIGPALVLKASGVRIVVQAGLRDSFSSGTCDSARQSRGSSRLIDILYLMVSQLPVGRLQRVVLLSAQVARTVLSLTALGY